MQKITIIYSMKKSYDLPEIVDKDPAEIKSIIEQIKTSSLPDDVKKFVIKCVELALWLPIFLQSKAISIHRLRTIIFGKSYNKNDNNSNTTSADSGDSSNQEPPESTTNQTPLDIVKPNKIGTPAKNDNADITTTDATSTVASLGGAASNDVQENTPNKKPGHGRNPHTDYTRCYRHSIVIKFDYR